MTASAPTRTVTDLSYLLSQASHVLTTQMAAAFTEIGITPREYCVLVHAQEAERTQIQLAKVSDLDKTTMVVTVDELEKAGLAERRPSSTDRRARIIAVTEAGERAVAEGMRVADRVHRDVLALLVGGHLSTPAESEHQVRRPRQRKI
jgi:MarR family transcriptional regulator for hemolysin